MGRGAAEDDRKIVELSRLHEHWTFDADGPDSIGGVGAAEARMDFESDARDVARKLFAAGSVVRGARRYFFAHSPEGGSHRVGWAARRKKFDKDGRGFAGAEVRVTGGGRTNGDGIVCADWIWRGPGPFVEGARTD